MLTIFGMIYPLHEATLNIYPAADGGSRHYGVLKNKPIGRCSPVDREGNICQEVGVVSDIKVTVESAEVGIGRLNYGA